MADGGEAKYRGYIDNVVKELKQVPFVRVVVQLETDAIGNRKSFLLLSSGITLKMMLCSGYEHRYILSFMI